LWLICANHRHMKLLSGFALVKLLLTQLFEIWEHTKFSIG